jgi:molecular chaperone GrpE (heat shock protein)
MLPSPKELRELSEHIRAAVPKAQPRALKLLLAGHAFRVAQVADQIERSDATDPLVRRAMVERYERLLADALGERTRRTVEALLARENHALDKQRREIEAWRRRAEEVRATADQFSVPSVQETLRRIADNLDKMADHAEALLTGKKAPGEKVG